MVMTNLSYKVDSDVVKTEGANRISRDEWVLPANFGDQPVGTVLSRVTATGATSLLAPTASDGTQNAAAVLLELVKNNAAAQRVVVLRRHAEVVQQALVFPAGITAPQIAAALASLEQRGIVARTGV